MTGGVDGECVDANGLTVRHVFKIVANDAVCQSLCTAKLLCEAYAINSNNVCALYGAEVRKPDDSWQEASSTAKDVSLLAPVRGRGMQALAVGAGMYNVRLHVCAGG